MALTAWFSAFFLGVILILSVLVWTVYGAVSTSKTLPVLESILVTLSGWLGLGIFGAVMALVSVSVEPLIELSKEQKETIVPIALSRKNLGDFTLVRFHSTHPVAFSVPGRRPEIFLSSAVEELLNQSQVRAVIAHEYAHLRQHHAWALRIAHINTLCLAGLRPGRALQNATTLLVELAADDAAARQAGAANLANALTILGVASGEESMLLRADRLTEKRWPLASKRRLSDALQGVCFS